MIFTHETLGHWLEAIATVIEVISVAILVAGSVRFIWTLGVDAVRRTGSARAFQEARLRLGIYILAALEFLIVADIIFTIANRTLEDVATLALIAAVRTLIGFFLNRELKELRERSGDDTPLD